MRKIKIEKWKSILPNGEEIEESLIEVLSILLSMKKSEDMPRGFENFRLMNRISNAFDRAKQTGELEFEESDYSFLKKTIEGEIPAVWGMNKNISRAIEDFLETPKLN
jgi:hypothetical protein